MVDSCLQGLMVDSVASRSTELSNQSAIADPLAYEWQFRLSIQPNKKSNTTLSLFIIGCPATLFKGS